MNKPAHRSGTQANSRNNWDQGECQRARDQSPRMIVERVVFTNEEHLGVQQQIERRARELWCAGGCRPDTSLIDWLQAEREVLQRFIWEYARRHALEQTPRLEPSVNSARRNLQTRIQKRGQAIEVSDLKPTPTLG